MSSFIIFSRSQPLINHKLRNCLVFELFFSSWAFQYRSRHFRCWQIEVRVPSPAAFCLLEPAYSTASSIIWAFYSSKWQTISAAIPSIWFSSSSNQYFRLKYLIQWIQPRLKLINCWAKTLKWTRFLNNCTYSRFPVIFVLSKYQFYIEWFSTRLAVAELSSKEVE